jgi:hypothetical protein
MQNIVSEVEPPQLEVTEEQLAQLFAEWDRRYRQDPDNFMSDVAHLLDETPESYGKMCAVYLFKLARELS